MNFPPPTLRERHMLDALAELVLSKDPSADDDAYEVSMCNTPLTNYVS